MQYCCPAKPQVISVFADIIHHLQSVVKIIFVSFAINIFCTGQLHHLRKNDFEQTAFVQQIKTNRRFFAQQYFVQFICNAFGAYNFYPLCVVTDCFKCFRHNCIIELCGKTNSPHHPQRIITESNAWCQRGFYYFGFNTIHSIKRIDELPIIFFVQTNGHGIDGKVTPVLIICQSTGCHCWFSAVMAVAFFSCTYKFYFNVGCFYLCCSKVFKKTHFRCRSKFFSHSFCQCNTIAQAHDVDIFC